MAKRRVALTGMGLITPLGIGKEAFWTGLMEGRVGVGPVAEFEQYDMPATQYARIPTVDYDEYLDPQRSALWSEASKLAVTGGVLAVRDAGGVDFEPQRTGTILGSGYGCVYDYEGHYRTLFDKGWKRVKPIAVPKMMPNAPASHLGIQFGARGINFSVFTACSSGAIATGLAAQQIRSGAIDACITGGVDQNILYSVAAVWNALRVLSRRDDSTASRPFSADRTGLVLGEGCAIFVLEEMEAARARDAHVYAEIAGVGTTNDATNIVGPDATGEIEAIRMALADAGLDPDAIGYVCAHGTGTEANDANETKVLKEAFGARAYEIPVSSIKGHIGHTMGAAGAIEVAATALALEHQRVPPTLHCAPGDPVCDLDYVTDGPRDVKMRHAMTNSFGFGGQNSTLILST